MRVHLKYACIKKDAQSLPVSDLFEPLQHTHTLAGPSSPTTVTSNMIQSPNVGTSASAQQAAAAQQLVNVPNLTSITQLPGLVYPLTMPTVLAAQGGVNSTGISSNEAKKLSGEL